MGDVKRTKAQQIKERYRSVGMASGSGELWLRHKDALRLVEDCRKSRVWITGMEFLKEVDDTFMLLPSVASHTLDELGPDPVETSSVTIAALPLSFIEFFFTKR